MHMYYIVYESQPFYLMNFAACTAGLISHVMLSGVKGACQGPAGHVSGGAAVIYSVDQFNCWMVSLDRIPCSYRQVTCT